jgi:hypothetical protein
MLRRYAGEGNLHMGTIARNCYVRSTDTDENGDVDDNDDNSIQFFILTCWLHSYKSQLQIQRKKIKYTHGTEINKKMITELN